MSDRQIKAVSLISGGLDSMLATRVVMEQGVHVEGINFFTGFCVEGHTHAIRNDHKAKPKRNNALWVAEQLGIKLHIVDIVEEYKDVVLNPRHGYGANLNPCLDCKIFMVSKAMEWIRERGFDFVITGEVIGQRPMSQRRDTMNVVLREAATGERLVRPLCARNLEPTLPEKQGWLDRERLYDFNGRGRKPQIALAAKFGFDDYAQPAGGCCFLTDKSYSVKLEDLWNSRHRRDYDLDDIMLLKVGRHLRPAADYKLIIARDEGESNFLEGYRKRFVHFRTLSHGGPLVMLDGRATDDDLQFAARLVARFSQGKQAAQVQVEVTPLEGEPQVMDVAPLPVDQVRDEWYV